MKTRVSITLEPATYQRAKLAARARKTSVSVLIQTLLDAAAPPATSSLVDQMIGSATSRTPEFGTDPLHDALASKYYIP